MDFICKIQGWRSWGEPGDEYFRPINISELDTQLVGVDRVGAGEEKTFTAFMKLFRYLLYNIIVMRHAVSELINKEMSL